MWLARLRLRPSRLRLARWQYLLPALRAGEHERVQAPCSRDFQLLAVKQV